jgi:cob(I)alamin adenosyltransferase
MAEKVKDLYISKRAMSCLWTFKTFYMQRTITLEIIEMLKQSQKQYNENLESIRDFITTGDRRIYNTWVSY